MKLIKGTLFYGFWYFFDLFLSIYLSYCKFNKIPISTKKSTKIRFFKIIEEYKIWEFFYIFLLGIWIEILLIFFASCFWSSTKVIIVSLLDIGNDTADKFSIIYFIAPKSKYHDNNWVCVFELFASVRYASIICKVYSSSSCIFFPTNWS